jgi:hypothetical protein
VPHTEHEDSPCDAATNPAEQLSQTLAPSREETVPEAQWAQKVEFDAAEYEPRAHSGHSLPLEGALKEPGEHARQPTEPGSDTQPGTQALQVLAAPLLNVRAAQSLHAVRPSLAAARPAAHVEHTDRPCKSVKRPRAHALQPVRPVALLK